MYTCVCVRMRAIVNTRISGTKRRNALRYRNHVNAPKAIVPRQSDAPLSPRLKRDCIVARTPKSDTSVVSCAQTRKSDRTPIYPWKENKQTLTCIFISAYVYLISINTTTYVCIYIYTYVHMFVYTCLFMHFMFGIPDVHACALIISHYLEDHQHKPLAMGVC